MRMKSLKWRKLKPSDFHTQSARGYGRHQRNGNGSTGQVRRANASRASRALMGGSDRRAWPMVAAGFDCPRSINGLNQLKRGACLAMVLGSLKFSGSGAE